MSLCCDLISVSEITTTLSSKYSKQYKNSPITLGGVSGTQGYILEGNLAKYQFHVTNPNVPASIVFPIPVFGNSCFMIKAQIEGVLISSSLLVGSYNMNQWLACFCISASPPVISTTFGSGTVSTEYNNTFAGATTAITTSGIGSSLTNPGMINFTTSLTPAFGTPCTFDAYFEVIQIYNTTS